MLTGPGAGTAVALDDLEGLASLYEHPAPEPGREVAVRVNMVASVDGAAAADGVTAPMSTPADRAVFRVLRAMADVVLVGAGTARAEDYGPAEVPRGLAGWRRSRGLGPTPVIVQVTRSGLVHEGRGMFAEPGRAAVVTSATDPVVLRRLRELAGETGVVDAPAGDGGIDVAAALAGLAARGWGRVLCEGGPTFLARMAAADAVDEWCVTTSPLAVPVAAPRITSGPEVGDPQSRDPAVRELALHGLAVHDSTVLARWRRRGRHAASS
ncbi:MAG: dihydrofolate reductase family protein [Kineosporiaceae bacterium]